MSNEQPILTEIRVASPGPMQGSLFGEAEALGYGTSGPVYDEMVTGLGRLRPHWQTFMSTLGPLEGPVMAERWEEARRLLHQNGVTYNIYGDPQGMERPWPLDMIPLLMPQHEWKALESGLIQRAQLLNAMLADLYGPQTLIRDGRLPATVIAADPGFRRAAHGVKVARDLYLHFYAVDLARAPDGRWWVLADRTQAPSGSGYALENRAVTSKVLPDSFRHCHVERLAPFFNAFKSTLMTLAPRRDTVRDGVREGGRIVLLTPGPYNETYFEHVYLARYLGITLVEGADLTVRDRQVFLKTLSGLEPVDVILRRLDDDFCDSLELRTDSSLGVPGLMQAVRAGTVVVANAIGSGLMESMSFKSYMPTLCRHLLGEELRLPGVASWWCGNDAERAYVLENLDGLVIKPAFPSSPFEPIFGAELAPADRRALADAIRKTPWNYVAQERLALSTAPVWQSGKLQPRPLVLRVFLCATDDGSYMAMPGGLTRVSVEPGRLVVSMQRGGGSKDTWVLAGRRVEASTGLAHAPVITEPRAPAKLRTSTLPSRVADGLFWLGRYAERSEGSLRLLRGAFTRLTDGSMPGAAQELKPILGLMAWLGMIPHDLAGMGSMGSGRALRTALHAAVFDPEHPNSLRAVVQRLHRTAYSVRDRLSLDMWRVVSTIEKDSEPQQHGRGGRGDAAAMLLRLDDQMTGLAALSGLEQESMTRGHGWRFLDFGRRVERALHCVSIMRGVQIADSDRMNELELASALEVLLELGESFMTYRERHFAAVHRSSVLELLLADESNPRALAFQLSVIQDHLKALPRSPGADRDDPTATALKMVEAARISLRNHEIVRSGSALAMVLDTLAVTLPDLSNLLAHAYFSHAFARPA